MTVKDVFDILIIAVILNCIFINRRGGKNKSKSNLTLSSSDEREGGLGSSSPSPIISMTTKHSNGSLNLWHLTVAEDSRFTQVEYTFII